MCADTTLLVSTDPSLIQQVQRLHDAADRLRLEVCGRPEKAHVEAGREDVGLVLLHVTEAGLDAEAARRLITHTAAPAKRIVVLACPDECPDHQAAVLRDEGAAAVLLLSQDIPRLTDFLTASAAGHHAHTVSRPMDHGNELLFTTLPEREEQMRQVRRVVDHDTTVLLTGETGTGKTILARRIHDLSPRHAAPFLIVDCGALSSSLIESEMFGHVKGAFTGADRNRSGKFAAVGRGTLVLDEINSLPAALQSKLLRVVEERVFEPVGSNQAQPLEARVIAISNAALEQEVAQGRFRADLYYRLNVVGFNLLPLRECRRAIASLAHQFLHEFTRHDDSAITGITDNAMALLEDYSWPGNIRQLRNVIERAVALSAGPLIEVGDLPDAVRSPRLPPLCPPLRALTMASPSWPGRTPENEPERIAEALQRHHNNRLRVAAELGISRTSLYKKLHKYGLFTGP